MKTRISILLIILFSICGSSAWGQANTDYKEILSCKSDTMIYSFDKKIG